MADSYLKNQNISNNIISNNQNNKLHDKETSLNKDELESYTSYDGDKNETIDNRINDDSLSSNDNEKINKKEDLNNIENSNKKSKIISNFNNQKRSLNNGNKNQNLVDSNKVNNLNTQKTFKKPISPNILSLKRETNIVLPNEVETHGKRTISGARMKSRQTQNIFDSSSENKFNFEHRAANSNDKVQNKNYIYKKGIFSYNYFNNNNIELAKVTKLYKEPDFKTNIRNNIIYNNKFYNYQTFNKFNANKNIISSKNN